MGKAQSRFLVPVADMQNPHTVELTIRKSRFLAQICHCPTVESGRSFAMSARSRFSDATHNCWAFVAGPPKDTARIGCSDDGEPHGTAGRPMLDVLLTSGIGEIGAVVSRWFGGIKLGTGGLVRAYQSAVKEALASLLVEEKTERIRFNISLPYSAVDGLHRLLANAEAVLESENYGEEAFFAVALPEDKSEFFLAGIKNLGAGKETIVLNKTF